MKAPIGEARIISQSWNMTKPLFGVGANSSGLDTANTRRFLIPSTNRESSLADAPGSRTSRPFGAIEAHRHTGMDRFVTVAMREVIFHEPVFVGDLVSFYAETLKIGTTSITVRVLVEAERYGQPGKRARVTEAEVVYVAVDEKQSKTKIVVK